MAADTLRSSRGDTPDGLSAPASGKTKISISFGAGAQTGRSSLNTNQQLSTGRKRARGVLGDDDEDRNVPGNSVDDEESDGGIRISSFGMAPGQVKQKAKEVVRVIPALPKRDWRDAAKAKRQKSGIPGQQQGQVSANGNTEVYDPTASGTKYGLTVVSSRTKDTENDAEPPTSTSAPDPGQPPSVNTSASANPSATTDEEAIARLLGQTSATDNAVIRPRSPPPTEDEAFRSAFATAPRAPTQAEYDATPVEGFGAAYLRGYLRAGETLDNKPSPRDKTMQNKDGSAVRRPQLLGLGAKTDGVKDVELDAWSTPLPGMKGKAGKGGAGAPRQEFSYNPVVLRNRITGEVISEHELKEKLEAQKKADVEGPAERSRGDEPGGRVRGRDRELENGTVGGDRGGGSRRDRDPHERDDHDRERRRRGEREDRNGERDRDRDKDKDSGRDKHRTRDGRHDRNDDDRGERDRGARDRGERGDERRGYGERRVHGHGERREERQRDEYGRERDRERGSRSSRYR